MSSNISQIRTLHKEFTDLKRRLSKIGYICTGTLMSLSSRCGKPSCACHRNQKALHGPYLVWTRTVQGKTVTRSLSARQAERWKECIKNMRETERIIEQLKELSAIYIESQR
jgi:hypothetical protein